MIETDNTNQIPRTMMIVTVKSSAVVDKEHGVTNTFTDTFITTSEEKAKELHKEDLKSRFGDNPFFGYVYNQRIVQS